MSASETKIIRIVVVTHYFPSHGGGIERVCEQLVTELAGTNRYEISWFASDCDSPPASCKNVVFHSIASWNIIEARLGLPYPIWSTQGCRALWKAAAQADVVHLHDFIYLGSLLGFLAARIASIPVVITQHIGFIPYKSTFARKLLETLNQTIGRYCLSHASAVVYVSQNVRDYFARFIRRTSITRLIPNGLDTKLFIPPTAEQRQTLRSALPALPGKPLLLFVGRFVEKKGMLILQQVAKELGSYTWLFAGSGPINPKDWKLPNVHVLGAVPQTKLASLYQAADLLVLPSKGEGFPLVVQEAMACSTPAMMSTETAQALEGLSDLVIGVDVDSPESSSLWVNAIVAATSDLHNLAHVGKRSAEFAHNNWSWKRCATQYDRLFTEVRYRTEEPSE